MYEHHVTEAGVNGPIVKPQPADEFRVYGSNAEMRWEVMREHGYVVPNASFFVRNHTSTPPRTGTTCSPAGPGPGTAPSSGPRSAPTAGAAGTRPSPVTAAPRPPGSGG